MYQAGLEFNDLLRDIRYFESDANQMAHYQDFSSRYGNVLRRYENVSDIDNLKGPLNISRKSRISVYSLYEWVKYWCLWVGEMLVYIIPIAFEFYFIVLLLT